MTFPGSLYAMDELFKLLFKVYLVEVAINLSDALMTI